MKIVFTGGGTGGHFYPIIAVAQAVRELSKERKLIEPTLYFVAPDPYNKKILFDNIIYFKKVPAGKIRQYISPLNFFDIFKTGWGILKALWIMFWIYPDVVFSKGGYGSFPVVLAARWLGIPIIIHESDSAPGKSNLWASKYADRIAISYGEAGEYFPEKVQKKIAWTGNPVRKEIANPAPSGAHEFLKLEENIPVILVVGGSQGAKLINDAILDALPNLIKKYQVIHQTGSKNLGIVKETAKLVMDDSQYNYRYHAFDYLDDLSIRMSAGAADLVISRAGSTIFEIASWGRPSIIIPITKTNNNHQRKNAYLYSRAGAASVIEESNLKPEILESEIRRILENKEIHDKMAASAKEFNSPDASRKIAKEIVDLGLTHGI